MKHTIFTFLLILVGFTIQAQTVIQGKVTDSKGSLLVGASVFLPEQNKGAICNDEGKYIIENIPTGKVVVQFSFLGYNMEIKPLIIQPGTNEINVSLTETILEMSEVLVVSGGIASSQKENSIKIESLTSKKIQLAGTPNLMEALSIVPGVDMISNGQGMSKPVIRGLSMNGILMTRDGVRIENYQYSVGHPVGIDDNGTEKVEIIKGPASLLYGSDAMGGVINFISERAASQGKITSDYKTQFHSNTMGFHNSVGIKGSSKHFFAGFRVSHKTNADYNQGGGEYVPNSRFNEYSANMNTGYHGKIGTFQLSYYYIKQKIGMITSASTSAITERGRENDVWYQDPSHHLISSRNKLFIGNIRCDVNAAWQSNVRSAYSTSEDPFIEMRLNTLTYETKIHLPSNENSDFIVGFQGMTQAHENINDRVKQSLPDADVSRIGMLTFAQHTFNKLKLQGGFRLDFSTIDSEDWGASSDDGYVAAIANEYINPNASLGATYQITNNSTLRANFAKAYRTPNLRELLYTGMYSNYYEVADENLNSEDAYESC